MFWWRLSKSWWLEKRAVIRRALQDRRQHPSHDFAQKLLFDKTGCRFLLAQYRNPIPTKIASRVRTHNLKLLEARLSSVLLQPGQIFSFWRLAGKPRREAGFKIGPVYDGQSLREGYDAGADQMASALYYLALLADFEILERTAGRLAPRAVGMDFVPLGLEALVHFPERDLRFRSTLPFNVALQVQVSHDALVVTLYGQQAMDIGSVLRSEVLAQTPFTSRLEPLTTHPHAPGAVLQAGHDGFHVKIVRDVVKNNQVVTSRVVEERHYPAIERISVALT